MTTFSIPEKMFLKIESLMCALRAHVNRTLNIKWKCSTSKNVLAAPPPRKVLQSWYLQFQTSLYFFLGKFQMQCFLLFSSLEHPPPCACEFLFFSSFFTFFFLGQQLLSFSPSHVALSSLLLEKKDPNFMERHEMEDLRAEKEKCKE